MSLCYPDKLLILDLDETLIHSTPAPLPSPAPPADLRVGPFFVYKRPHVDAFLQAVRTRFHLAIWTAATPAYAAPIVSMLLGDAVRELVFFYTFRHCTEVFDPEAGTVQHRKRLSKIRRRRRRGFSRGQMLIVDNTPATYADNYGNGVPVRDFRGDPLDQELPGLLHFLDVLGPLADVRPAEKRGWQWRFGHILTEMER